MYRLLLGTQSSEKEEYDYSYLATASISKQSSLAAGKPSETSAAPSPNSEDLITKQGQNKFSISHKKICKGDVNRARYMPQDPSVVAVRTSLGPVPIHRYDFSSESTTPIDCAILSGLEDEGFGLSWNLQLSGTIAATSNDGHCCIWDCQSCLPSQSSPTTSSSPPSSSSSSSNIQTIAPLYHFVRDVPVNSCEWDPHNQHVLALAQEDSACCLFDTRMPLSSSSSSSSSLPSSSSPLTPANPVVRLWHTTNAGINTLAFHPDAGYGHFLLTGAADGKILLWDVRSPQASLHSFECHTASVNHIAWAPPEVTQRSFTSSASASASSSSPSPSPSSLGGGTVFASCSDDTRVILWDLRKIGEEIVPSEDMNDAPTEVFFIHSGHTASVSEVAWSGAATTHSFSMLPWLDPTLKQTVVQTQECAEEGEEKKEGEDEDEEEEEEEDSSWLLASVDSENILQVWRYAKDIAPQDPDEEEYEKERAVLDIDVE